MLLHRTLRTLLTAAHYRSQVAAPDQIETKEVPFIGMTLKLQTKRVTPIVSRLAKLAAFIRTNEFRNTTNYTVWDSLTGKIIAYAMLNRGILAQFHKA